MCLGPPARKNLCAYLSVFLISLTYSATIHHATDIVAVTISVVLLYLCCRYIRIQPEDASFTVLLKYVASKLRGVTISVVTLYPEGTISVVALYKD